MRSVRTSTAWIGLALITGGVPLLAQLQDNSEKQLTCSNGGFDNDRARHCEIREQSLPSIGRLSLDAGQNGGATIKGWQRGDVLVRARVEASGENEAAASIMASRVMVDGSGGQVRATGPESANNSWWSVSYEIFIPQVTDLTLKTNNGGITVSDVRGQIHFDADQRRRAPEARDRRCHRRHRQRRDSGRAGRRPAGMGAKWNSAPITAASPSPCPPSTPPAYRPKPEWAAFQSDFPLPTDLSTKVAEAGLQCRCRRCADSHHHRQRLHPPEARRSAVSQVRRRVGQAILPAILPADPLSAGPAAAGRPGFPATPHRPSQSGHTSLVRAEDSARNRQCAAFSRRYREARNPSRHLRFPRLQGCHSGRRHISFSQRTDQFCVLGHRGV